MVIHCIDKKIFLLGKNFALAIMVTNNQLHVFHPLYIILVMYIYYAMYNIIQAKIFARQKFRPAQLLLPLQKINHWNKFSPLQLL